jgi:hypothetical protein
MGASQLGREAMKTYTVSFKYEAYRHYTVEAENRDDAENAAYDLLLKDAEPLEGEYTDTEIEES